MGGRRADAKQKVRRSRHSVVDALREAVKGLTYPSETDAPFDVFVEERAMSAEDVVAHRTGGGKVAAVAVEEFFAELEGTSQAERYRRLRAVLCERLAPLKIFRVGAVKVDIYLVGKAGDGTWVGLHTTSVET